MDPNLIVELVGTSFFLALGLLFVFGRDLVWRIYNGGVEPRTPEKARTPGWDESVRIIGFILLAAAAYILFTVLMN